MELTRGGAEWMICISQRARNPDYVLAITNGLALREFQYGQGSFSELCSWLSSRAVLTTQNGPAFTSVRRYSELFRKRVCYDGSKRGISGSRADLIERRAAELGLCTSGLVGR